jgi:hypothetical protein
MVISALKDSASHRTVAPVRRSKTASDGRIFHPLELDAEDDLTAMWLWWRTLSVVIELQFKRPADKWQPRVSRVRGYSARDRTFDDSMEF